MERFDVDLFKNQLHTTWIGSEFIYIDKARSTNSFLKELPTSDLAHGTVALTDHQLNGRGQYERKWEAAPFKNLTFTIGFRPPAGNRLTLLTLGCAGAIANVIENYTRLPVHIKWPNDILVGGKKIGGLLTECIFSGSTPDRVLIGIGLNIFQKRFSKDVEGQAVSLNSVSEMPVSREKLLSQCLAAIERVYHQWHNFEIDLQRSINKRLIGYGEWVRLSIYQHIQEEKFKFIGISDKGELLMLNQQLDVNKFSYEQVRIITGEQEVSKAEKSLPV